MTVSKKTCVDCLHFEVCGYNSAIRAEANEVSYKNTSYIGRDRDKDNEVVVATLRTITGDKISETKAIENLREALFDAVDGLLGSKCIKYTKPPFGKEIKRE